MFAFSLTLSWLLDHVWLLVDWLLVGRLRLLMEGLHCSSLGKCIAFSGFSNGHRLVLAKLLDVLGGGIDVLRVVRLARLVANLPQSPDLGKKILMMI